MNYAIGYLAGRCDRRGWLLARDVLYALPFFSAARIDGFDPRPVYRYSWRLRPCLAGPYGKESTT